MSTPLDTQEPPPVAVAGQAHATGSVGPVIAVLAVITILGIAAGLIGRLCSGHRVMGHGDYDCEGWLERKCSSCIDGRVGPSPTPTRPRREASGREVIMEGGPSEERNGGGNQGHEPAEQGQEQEQEQEQEQGARREQRNSSTDQATATGR